MKKLLAILLIPVFLLTTAGVAMTSLYCKGKIVETGITVKPCCKDVNKGGCCNTESQVIKIQDSFVHDSYSVDVATVFTFYTETYSVLRLPGCIFK